MTYENENLLDLIDRFAGLRLIVLGEAMLDAYVQGQTERLCREAPVPVVDVHEKVHVPGGAANAAVNLASLGAQVEFLSVTGDDENGRYLLEALHERHIPTLHVLRSPQRATLTKQRIVAGSQVLVRVDQGTTTALEADLENDLINRLIALFPECDGVVVSDYAYGIITPAVLETLRWLQREQPRMIVVDSRRPHQYHDLGVTAVKPNYEETASLLGLEKMSDDSARLKQIEEHGHKVLDVTGAQVAAITLDHTGALVFQRDNERPYRTYAQPQPGSRAAGAGDTFVSALAAGLAAGAHVEHAAELASAAAAIVVGKDGTASCFANELKNHFATGEKFVSDLMQLVMRVTYYRQTGQRIVFTNGCFDILHRGHIAYLNHAKSLGDILIVGLNSDESVARLKGPDRPINTLEDRAQVLAALSCVDHIVSFSEDTPSELIKIIKPDVFAKGGDYTHQSLPEAGIVEELGGQVEILPYVKNQSTTSTIEKIRALFESRAMQNAERPGEQSHDT